jgi:hypothetical protein
MIEDAYMMLKRFPLSNKPVLAFLLISLLLCMDIALGSMLDVHVYYGEKPAAQASVYIDNDILLGQTDSNGTLKGINISPGPHTVVAKWRESNGQLQSGTVSFTAQPDFYTMKRIDIPVTRNLGWIWQFVKNTNG